MIWFYYAIVGLGSGAVIAMLGTATVVGFRGSGIVNFALCGVAMYTAYLYYDLRTSGLYLQPIPGLPVGVQVGPSSGTSTAVALLLSIATAAVLGILMHLLVLRPLRTAPQLAQVVATIGILLIFEAIVTIRFSTTAVSVPSMLPSGDLFSLGSSGVPKDRMFLVLVAVVVAIGMAALYAYSRFGLATRGAAENENAATLLGYSPDLLAGASWAISGVLAGVAGILAAPITNLSPTTFTSLVVPTLAAALIGRFESVGAVAVSGLLIGAAQAELAYLPGKFTWLPATGLPDALPVLVIIVVMFIVGRALPNRLTTYRVSLPPVPETRRMTPPLLAFAIVAGVLMYVVSGDYRLAMINTLIAAIVCLSLVVLTGFVGQISLFQLTVSGVAAYLLGVAANSLHIPFPFGLVIAAVVAAGLGLLGALPALRVRGVNLAVITLGIGWGVEQVFFGNTSYTGGYNGVNLANLTIFGHDVGFTSGASVARPIFGIVVLVSLVLLAMVVINLRRGDTGRRMLAVRANERAAASLGINSGRTKMLAFGIASFVAGVAGGLTAYQQTHISPTSFDVFISMSLLAVAYIGGITTVSGAVIGGLLASGGVVFYLLQVYVFTNSVDGTNLQLLIAGVGLVLTAILNPHGVALGTTTAVRSITRRRAQRPTAAVEAT